MTNPTMKPPKHAHGGYDSRACPMSARAGWYKVVLLFAHGPGGSWDRALPTGSPSPYPPPAPSSPTLCAAIRGPRGSRLCVPDTANRFALLLACLFLTPDLFTPALTCPSPLPSRGTPYAGNHPHTPLTRLLPSRLHPDAPPQRLPRPGDHPAPVPELHQGHAPGRDVPARLPVTGGGEAQQAGGGGAERAGADPEPDQTLPHGDRDVPDRAVDQLGAREHFD